MCVAVTHSLNGCGQESWLWSRIMVVVKIHGCGDDFWLEDGIRTAITGCHDNVT